MEDLAAFAYGAFHSGEGRVPYYSENFVDTSDSSLMFNVTDRATLNGILERNGCLCDGGLVLGCTKCEWDTW